MEVSTLEYSPKVGSHKDILLEMNKQSYIILMAMLR